MDVGLFSEHEFIPRNPTYQQVVRDTFDAQRAMALIGAELVGIGPGWVEISLETRPELTQQHGILHGGVIAMVLDSACAFAIASLLPADGTGFTAQYDVKFLAPAKGSLLARGEVLRIGRNIAMSTSTGVVASGNGAPQNLVACATEVATHFRPPGPAS